MTGAARVLLALAGWGALAFGAVYPWAYWPLAAASAAAGIWLWRRGRGAGKRVSRRVLAAVVLVAAPIAIQLVPLPYGVLSRTSPQTVAFLRNVDLQFAASAAQGGAPAHPLSVAPAATLRGLAITLSFGLLLLGAHVGLSSRDARAVVRGALALGFIVAFVSLLQQGTGSPLVYGFWRPQLEVIPSAPFINRNHLAGWLLMTMPLAAGLFIGLTTAGPALSARAWRSWVLLQTHPVMLERLLAVLCVVALGVALLFTRSRSGFVLLAIFTCAFALAMTTGQRWAGKVRAVALIAAVAAAVFIGIGMDWVMARFHTIDVSFAQRMTAWGTAMRIAADFSTFGTGFNTFGVVSVLYEAPESLKHYAHTHNDYLQLAAEGGYLLAVPTAGALVLLASRAGAALREAAVAPIDWWVRAGALGGACLLGLQEAVDFSLQMPGNAVWFVVLLALACRRSAREPRRSIS